MNSRIVKLTLCSIGFLSLTQVAAFAQLFTPVPYNFPAAAQVRSLNTVSPCWQGLWCYSMAANGVGQWLAYSETVNPNDYDGPAKWALLANHQEDDDATCSYHGGIVQTGTFDPGFERFFHPRVTANLVGNVRSYGQKAQAGLFSSFKALMKSARTRPTSMSI